MATVTIRRLDDEVLDALKRQARIQGRSLEAELREIPDGRGHTQHDPGGQVGLFERIAEGREAA